MDVTTDAGQAGTPEPAAIAMTPPADTPERLSPTEAGRSCASFAAVSQKTPNKRRQATPRIKRGQGSAPRVPRSSRPRRNRPPDLIRGATPTLPQ